MDYQVLIKNLIIQGSDVALKVLGAIIVWIVGSWLISFTNNLITRSLAGKKVEETLVKYTTSAVNILLTLILIVAIFSYFGFQTTTIAGLLAGVGLAIGTMWGGMMSNLAAGAFMAFLKPFKVGDFISAGDHRDGEGNRAVHHLHGHPGQRPHLRGQQQDFFRQHPEFYRQPLSPG